MTMFKKATKKSARLRLALIGPSGAGKTFTALSLASSLGKRIAVIDTERGSASKYADIFEFDALELESFAPASYVQALRAAEAEGYDVVIIDSLSHAWFGKDGALEQVDRAAKRSQSGNTFNAWREVTPQHNALVDAIVSSKCHVIATMRAKTEYVIETNAKGKQVPRKIGLAPIQRDGLEYEFDVVGTMTTDNDLIVDKTRCSAMAGQVYSKPGADVAAILIEWLGGESPTAPAPAAKPVQAAGPSVKSTEPDYEKMLRDASCLEELMGVTQLIAKNVGKTDPRRSGLLALYKECEGKLKRSDTNGFVDEAGVA